MPRPLASLAAILLLAGCSLVGIRSGYEQPAYDVLETVDEDVEIRRYPARVAAETTVEAGDADSARNRAFEILFDYISGANRGEVEVAMTAPVATRGGTEVAMTAPVESVRSEAGRYTMRFFLPASYDERTAPAPTDPRVQIVEVPETNEAVLRFSGSRDEAAVRDRQAALLEALAGTRWRASGPPSALFYDPPWTLPLFRRNEVAVPVVATAPG